MTETDRDGAGEPAAVAVRQLDPADLRAAARLHADALSEGFLAQLGPGFLRRYLDTFRTTPGAVALAAQAPDGAFAGFVVGSTCLGHNRQALQLHWRSLLPAAALALGLRPRVLWQFLRTRAARYGRVALITARGRRGGGPPARRATTTGGPVVTAVLLHVAVEVAGRGNGAGSALVEASTARARAAGCTRARLMSFGETDAFYTRLGWTPVSARTDDDGRRAVLYGLDL